ncbi:MAG TPA: hypothetical protein VGW80_12595 [Solirubrobacterales bacterium]|jgi:hypothetical protein|nr:hypothetical protein [Solirubrobacterales bacterium]
MVPRPVVPVVAVGAAFAVMALPVPLGSTPFGCFFGFDFPAEFFVFGVFGFAAFAFVFVVYFFDRDRLFFALVGFVVFRFDFVVLRFNFVVFSGEEGQCRRGRREA